MIHTADNEGQIVLYQPDESISLEVKLEQETVWLTQPQMVQLFNSSKGNISEHITNIYEQGELTKDSTVRKFRTVRKEGNRVVARNLDYYNLDMIISVGFRVNSQQGIRFRQWANQVLKEYLLRGYSINRQLVAMQERTDNRFLQLEQRLDHQQEQIDFFIRTNVPPVEGIFYEGQVLDARLFAEQLIHVAQREVILIDNYIDARTFEILEMRNTEVNAMIYVERVGNGLRNLQLTSEAQTGRTIDLQPTRQRIHDRFLIIDDEVYHLGASLNELGKRLFAFSRMQMSKEVIMSQVR